MGIRLYPAALINLKNNNKWSANSDGLTLAAMSVGARGAEFDQATAEMKYFDVLPADALQRMRRTP